MVHQVCCSVVVGSILSCAGINHCMKGQGGIGRYRIGDMDDKVILLHRVGDGEFLSSAFNITPVACLSS